MSLIIKYSVDSLATFLIIPVLDGLAISNDVDVAALFLSRIKYSVPRRRRTVTRYTGNRNSDHDPKRYKTYTHHREL